MLLSRGSITTQIGGEFKVLQGRPSLEYVNSKTIYLDLEKNRLSIIDAEKTLLVAKKRKKEQRKIAKERELAEKRAIEERNNRIKAERKREKERKRQAELEEAIRKWQAESEKEERKRQAELKEEERKRQAELERLARFEEDLKTQVLPSDYHLKIRKYLRRILYDPESLQISKISKPLKYVLNKNYRDLSPGNIVYQCEVCYNSKNRFGGYTGVQCYDLIFRDGEVIDAW